MSEVRSTWHSTRSRPDRERYDYALVTSTRVLPEELDVAVYGHHRSTCLSSTRRLWAFQTKSGVDLVRKTYANEVLSYVEHRELHGS